MPNERTVSSSTAALPFVENDDREIGRERAQSSEVHTRMPLRNLSNVRARALPKGHEDCPPIAFWLTRKVGK